MEQKKNWNMWVKVESNEYGTDTSHHVCDTCATPFTITPAAGKDEKGYESCCCDECDSYDPHRDAEILFMTNAEIAREKKVVSIFQLRKRRDGIL